MRVILPPLSLTIRGATSIVWGIEPMHVKARYVQTVPSMHSQQLYEPRTRSKSQEPKIGEPRYGFQDLHIDDYRGFLLETGPHGSIWDHVKSGESCMAQDHFQARLTQHGP